MITLSTHSPAATQSTAPHTATAEKVKRPTINPAGTCEEWDYFKQRWEDYKQATRLTGKDVIFQLLECCEESLRKDLTRTHDKLSDQPEATVLDFIKRLAVRPENLLVARVQLQYMRQERDEPIRSFCARLKEAKLVFVTLLPRNSAHVPPLLNLTIVTLWLGMP